LVLTATVGYVFLKLLFKILIKEKFHMFAYYCWAIGLTIILTQNFNIQLKFKQEVFSTTFIF